jgi:hypothetical protein
MFQFLPSPFFAMISFMILEERHGFQERLVCEKKRMVGRGISFFCFFVLLFPFLVN